MKHLNKMFLMVALVMLVIGLSSAVSAVDDNTTDSVISETSADTTVEPVTTTTDSDATLKNTKQIEKATKENVKTATKTVEVNDYNELATAINNAVADSENDEYVINLNNGTYQITANTVYNSGTYTPSIIINANNQTLSASANTLYTNFNNGCEITINDAKITQRIQNNNRIVLNNVMLTNLFTNRNYMKIVNSTINAQITNNEFLTIDENTVVLENFKIAGNGLVDTNNTDVINSLKTQGIYIKDDIIENQNITTLIKNYANLTVRNSSIKANLQNYDTLTIESSTINSTITNSGILVLSDDIVIGAKFSVTGSGQIIINDTTKITPYLSTFTGNMVIENITLSGSKTNNGNLTIRNCTWLSSFRNNGNVTIENSITGGLQNFGNVTIKNSTVNGTITNNGLLVIDDDVEWISSWLIKGDGYVMASNMSKIFPYIEKFSGEATITLDGEVNVSANYGNLTIENSTLRFNNGITNYANSQITLKNSTISAYINNYGVCELINATSISSIVNYGTLIISDDSHFSGLRIEEDSQVIINDTQRIADYLTIYTGNIVLSNKTYADDKVNNGNLTLINCTFMATITNNGQLTIDNYTTFSGDGKITGNGKIITDNITKLLPYIDCINGNYSITDTTLNKTYTFNGNVTLNNCTITKPENNNLGTLYLNNCNINVGEENVFLDNLGTVYVDKNTQIIGQIENIGGQTNYEPEYEPKTIVVTNRTAKHYFDAANNGKLSELVNPGDTLDFQGTISGIPNLNNLCINKPVNIISTTKDAVVCLNTTNGDLSGSNPGNSFSIVKEGAYTNITGIYFFNTQLWLYNTDHVTLDNISAVVDNQSVGSGVGQTSIRANSSYITVKNSYFYTRNNGGSSTLVLAYANYCTIVNNTIVGGGGCGNLLYLTTYNVDVPKDVVYNSYNVLANNTLIGPEGESSICWAIVLSGTGNLVDANELTFNGAGINIQWGSGSGTGEGDGLYNITGNTITNNRLYGKCGIQAGDIIYNNYVENGDIYANNALVYNNTASGIILSAGKSEITNNTINGEVKTGNTAESSLIANNTINGNINIISGASNITLTGNNITGTVTLDGSNNQLIDNRIINHNEYTIQSRRLCQNNIIRDNYLLSKTNAGDESVNLKDSSNIIENNLPINTHIEVIAASEVTVNTTTPVIIIVTRKGELVTEDITLTVKGENETVTAKNGIIVYQYTPDTVGEQEIIAKFAGYGDYMTSTTTVMITVTPDKDAIIEELNNTVQQASKDCILTIDAIPDIKFNDNLTVYGKLMDTKGIGISGEKVTVNVNGVDNTVTTDANGVWKLKIKTTTLGTNNVTATYSGTQYNPFTTSTTFEIAQTEAIITIDKIVTTQFRDNVTITGTFKNSNGKAIANSKVRVNINGYSTYVTTDHDGVWSLTVKTNKTGVNNVTASFSGNANYAKYTANATFNVTKQDLVITTEVKFNKGNFTITGTFVDKNGNKLSNSKIRVNINGKAVYVKTDSNGTYTYSEMITVKTIKYNVYYGGSANYNSYTSSKTTLTVA